MPIDLVGRAAEIEELDRFLDELAGSPPAPVGLLIQGPAGIGKSSVWTAGLDRAKQRRFLVLAARPSEAEATFAFQALADLFEPIDSEVAALPRPQRRNLEIALLRDERQATESIDPQAVATAASNVVRGAAIRQPLLLAVDDAPWLDHASAAALAFIVRRLADRRVGVLVSQRADGPAPAPLELDRAVTTRHLWLGPMGRADLHALLATRLGLVLPRPTLARLHEQAQGNPFHALEIARALQQLPALPRPGEPLPVPESIRALIAARLAVLTDDARRLLLLAALAGAPTVSLMESAGSAVGLDEVIDAGIVTLEGSTIRFTHPLIASTLVASASDRVRREAHRTLAATIAEPEAGARHLALAATTPDPDVASSLELAAVDAERRGARDTAVELYRLSVDLTPPVDVSDRDRRLVRLGTAIFLQGDLNAAAAILDEAVAALPPGRLRAEALFTRGTVAWYPDGSRVAISYLEKALQALGRPPRPGGPSPDDRELAELVGRIHLWLGQFEEDMRVSREHRAEAAALLEHTAARTSYASALLLLFWADVALGRPPDMALFERGLALEEQGQVDSSTIPGHWWLHTDRPDLARERLEWMVEMGREHGDLSNEPDGLTQLAQAAIYADDWPRARSLIDDALILAAQEGEQEPLPAIRVRALIDVHEGRLEEAERAAGPGEKRVFERGDVIVSVAFLHVLTLAAASRGDAARVDELTSEAMARLRSIGFVEPLRHDPVPERIEALVALGRLDEAATLLEDLERRGHVVPRPWVDAAVARGRGRLLAARGDGDAAVEATNAAMDERSTGWRSFDRARTQFVRGQILRQLRRPRDAGAAMDAALATFERLGARVWAERCRAELGRLGRRRPGRDDLTPAERQVAALAASGLRNHEVASQLGISPKTVEAHLARVYAKLGIRSRAELGRLMAPRVDRRA